MTCLIAMVYCLWRNLLCHGRLYRCTERKEPTWRRQKCRGHAHFLVRSSNQSLSHYIHTPEQDTMLTFEQICRCNVFAAALYSVYRLVDAWSESKEIDLDVVSQLANLEACQPLLESYACFVKGQKTGKPPPLKVCVIANMKSLFKYECTFWLLWTFLSPNVLQGERGRWY